MSHDLLFKILLLKSIVVKDVTNNDPSHLGTTVISKNQKTKRIGNQTLFHLFETVPTALVVEREGLKHASY